jgi:hypothetical protein
MQRDEPWAAQLLDLVHSALQAADYAALARLEQGLAQEMARPGLALSTADLQLIKRRAERNAHCLQAAGRGIRAARRRLAEIRGAATGLVTYDRAGKRADVGESGRLAQRL